MCLFPFPSEQFIKLKIIAVVVFKSIWLDVFKKLSSTFIFLFHEEMLNSVKGFFVFKKIHKLVLFMLWNILEIIHRVVCFEEKRLLRLKGFDLLFRRDVILEPWEGFTHIHAIGIFLPEKILFAFVEELLFVLHKYFKCWC